MRTCENVLNLYVGIQQLVGITYSSDSAEVHKQILRQRFVQ